MIPVVGMRFRFRDDRVRETGFEAEVVGVLLNTVWWSDRADKQYVDFVDRERFFELCEPLP